MENENNNYYVRLNLLLRERRVLVLSLMVVVLSVLLTYRIYQERKYHFSTNGQPYGISINGATPQGSLDVGNVSMQGAIPNETPVKVATKIDLKKETLYGKKLQTFNYSKSGGQVLGISGTCVDAYYTVLIFKKSSNFQTHPGDNVFNNAFLCPDNKKIAIEIDISHSNFSDGVGYYLLVADQGKSGTWYNAR